MKKSEEQILHEIEILRKSYDAPFNKILGKVGINRSQYRKLLKKKKREEEKQTMNKAETLTAPTIDLNNLELDFSFVEKKKKTHNVKKSDITLAQFLIFLNKEGITINQCANKCGLSISTLKRFPFSKKTYDILVDTFPNFEEYTKVITITPTNPDSNTSTIVQKQENLDYPVGTKMATYGELQKENKCLKQQLDKVKSISEDLEEENKLLKAQLIESTKKIESLQNKLESNETEKAVDLRSVETEELKRELERYKNKYAEIEELKRELERYKKMVDKLL